jgi:O6-methylguanine-DNA--protein-cysteine methyltransferase
MAAHRVIVRIITSQLIPYGELAENIEHPKASRVVSSAIGRNPIAYIILPSCNSILRRNRSIRMESKPKSRYHSNRKSSIRNNSTTPL